MKNLWYIFIFTSMWLSDLDQAQAQVIYQTEWKSEASHLVFVTRWKSEADLIVHKTEWKSEAKAQSGIWYFTGWKSVADMLVYFTKWKSEANLIVYYTTWKSEAGWRTKNSGKTKEEMCQNKPVPCPTLPLEAMGKIPNNNVGCL